MFTEAPSDVKSTILPKMDSSSVLDTFSTLKRKIPDSKEGNSVKECFIINKKEIDTLFFNRRRICSAIAKDIKEGSLFKFSFCLLEIDLETN